MDEIIDEAVEEITKWLSDTNKKEIKALLADALSFGPELYNIINQSALGLAEITRNMIKSYVDNGFSKEEAIALCVSDFVYCINQL